MQYNRRFMVFRQDKFEIYVLIGREFVGNKIHNVCFHSSFVLNAHLNNLPNQYANCVAEEKRKNDKNGLLCIGSIGVRVCKDKFFF